MSDLSKGWRRVKLGDVAINSTAVSANPEAEGFERYIIGKNIPEDADRIETWGPVGDSDFGPRIRTIFQPGDVICTTRGPKLKVARADLRGLGAHTNFYLRTADSNTLLQPYLEAVVRSRGFRQHLVNNFRGSVNLFVNWSDAAEYKFALPPLEEQRRIVEVLKVSSTVAESHKALASQLIALKASATEALVSGTNSKSCSIGQLCSMQNGKAFPGGEYCDDGIRLLRPGNLAPTGYLSWNMEKTVCMPERYQEEAAEHIVDSGDVLINLTAQSLEDGFMGRVCLARDGDMSLLNQRIGRFENFSDQVLPEYLYRVLQSQRFLRHAVAMCEGSKIKHLFWDHISRFEFPLPTLTRQSMVVQILGSIDSTIQRARVRHAASQVWKSQLLSSAMDASAGDSR